MFIKKHPKNLWILSFGKLWDTFSYFGTQTIIALYFIKVFHLSQNNSYLIYGAYAAFAFSTPILGGIVADKWLGSKQSLILGAILNILGNLLLISLHRYVFCLGLATSIIGSGLYKSNSTNLIGTLYKAGDEKKEQGYTWFYMAMNLGGVFAPLVYGFIAYALAWNLVFLFSALGIFLGTLLILKNWKYLSPNSVPHKPFPYWKKFILFTGVIIVCLVLSLPFYFPCIINLCVFILFLIGIFYLILSIQKYSKQHKKRLYGLLLIFFLALFYFAAGLQIGTSITLFMQYKIQQGIINIQLPASTFSLLYCFFVLLLVPMITYLWVKLKNKGIIFSLPIKLTISIGLATLGISAFVWASLTNLVIAGIIIGNFLLSAGEVILTPSLYTTISDSAPEGIKSTMMGGLLFFIALGGYTSSLLANAANFLSQSISLFSTAYTTEFFIVMLFTMLITIISALMIPMLTKMMK